MYVQKCAQVRSQPGEEQRRGGGESLSEIAEEASRVSKLRNRTTGETLGPPPPHLVLTSKFPFRFAFPPSTTYHLPPPPPPQKQQPQLPTLADGNPSCGENAPKHIAS